MVRVSVSSIESPGRQKCVVCVCACMWVSEQHEAPSASGYSVYFLLINMKAELRCALIWPFCNMEKGEQKSIKMHSDAFFTWCCEYSAVSWASTLPCPTRCFWQTVSCPCVRNLENSVAVLVITQPLWAEGARLVLCSQHICSALSSVETWHISSPLHLSIRSKVRSKVIPLTDALSKTPWMMLPYDSFLEYDNVCWRL